MVLDPALRDLLAFFDGAGYPSIQDGSPDDARKGIVALARMAVDTSGLVTVGSVVDREVAGLPARVYRPDTPGPHPSVLFLHGGGWVIGDLESHDAACRRLCRDVDAVVVAVDYRLAPEHPFPAAVDDALAAASYVVAHRDEFGGAGPIGVAGDSAGGNLSAVVAQRVPGIDAQLLVYPATDAAGDGASREENGVGYLLELATMEWFGRHYLSGADVALDDARLSPLHGELAGLPPAVVVTAEFDPLRDEGEAYAAALDDAGVAVDLVRYDGLIHGFLDLGAFSPAAAEAVTDVNARFRRVLDRVPVSA